MDVYSALYVSSYTKHFSFAIIVNCLAKALSPEKENTECFQSSFQISQ